MIVSLAIAAAIGACTLLDGDPPPPATCKLDADCFRTQEVCNTSSHTCVAKPDAGIDAP